jgi:hypothetical protein
MGEVAGGMAQAEKHLPSKGKVLSSKPGTATHKKIDVEEVLLIFLSCQSLCLGICWNLLLSSFAPWLEMSELVFF